MLKSVLRKQIRAAMAACDRSLLKAESQSVMAQLEALSEFQKARVVAMYWPLGDEVDTRSFIEKWACEKLILLPVVEGLDIRFRRFDGVGGLVAGALGVLEPCLDDDCGGGDGGDYGDLIDSIDLIVVPGVAFDGCGGRMGRGRGYYDRFLGSRYIYKVGVCFSAQFVDCVPCEGHDIAMDQVIVPVPSGTRN